jgi:hypothetical protein
MEKFFTGPYQNRISRGIYSSSECPTLYETETEECQIYQVPLIVDEY